MKILLLGLFIILGFSACTTHDDGYYDRANRASEKAHQQLDRE